VVAFFAMVGGSALATSSGGPPEGQPTSTEAIEEPGPAGENPVEATPPADQAEDPVQGDEVPLPSIPVGDAPAAPEADPGQEHSAQSDAPGDDEALPAPESEQDEKADTRRTAGKPDKARKDERGGHESGGPPPWAPAHGFRCKQAGNAPGSAAFRDCIKARKKLKPSRHAAKH